jgi:hypothetical protein
LAANQPHGVKQEASRNEATKTADIRLGAFAHPHDERATQEQDETKDPIEERPAYLHFYSFKS